MAGTLAITTAGLASPARADSGPGPIVGIGAKCLDDQGGLTTDGNPIVLATCHGSVEQQWTLQTDGTIRNQGHCLAVQHAGTTSTTPVWLYTCDGGPAQLWSVQANHTIVNPHSGLCLADSNGSTSENNPIWVYTCDAGPAQLWTVPTATTDPSGAAMPVGDLPADSQGPNGWHQVFADNFPASASGTATSTGALPDGKWKGYPDGWTITNSTNGVYKPSKTVSVANGVLTFNLHTEGSSAYAAVEYPNLAGSQTYGRYDVRYRYEPGSNLAGYKSVWMTWPDDDTWGEGEDDFAEYPNAANRTNVQANLHHACATTPCVQEQGTYNLDPTQWHTATEIWSPGNVSAYVDGHLIKTSTTAVPSTPMHLLLQTEASNYGPQADPATVVKIDVDWATVYTRK